MNQIKANKFVQLLTWAHKVSIFICCSFFSLYVLADNSTTTDLGAIGQNSINGQKQNQPSNVKNWLYIASTGDREAQFRLGLYYSTLQANAENLQRSVYWYDAAAKQGHPLAQYNLGVKLMKGEGIAKDQSKALSLWLQAANAGHMQAQFNVGRAYFLGVGFDENHRKAKFWFKKAAQQGEPKSRELLTKLGWNKPSKATPVIKNTSKTSEIKSARESGRTLSDGPVDLYTGPNSHNRFMMQLPNSQGLSVLATRGQHWFKVRSGQGFPVWVYQDFIKRQSTEPDKGTILRDSVRARGIPETSSGTIIGFFQKGEKLAILEHKGEWYRVVSPTRFTAWVKRKNNDNELKQLSGKNG